MISVGPVVVNEIGLEPIVVNAPPKEMVLDPLSTPVPPKLGAITCVKSEVPSNKLP